MLRLLANIETVHFQKVNRIFEENRLIEEEQEEGEKKIHTSANVKLIFPDEIFYSIIQLNDAAQHNI